jgi:hypothetical protein
MKTRELANGATKVAIVLHPEDIKIVSDLADKMSVSFSGAVRIVIRDWDKRTNPQPAQAEPVEAE